MKAKKETTVFYTFEIIIALIAIILLIKLYAFAGSRGIYVDGEAETASQTARNSVSTQQYLPPSIQWHMENQVGIDNGYFEKGTLDYGCHEQGWKLKHMDCSASGVGYTLEYTPQGRIMRFEWDYAKKGT